MVADMIAAIVPAAKSNLIPVREGVSKFFKVNNSSIAANKSKETGKWTAMGWSLPKNRHSQKKSLLTALEGDSA